MHRNVIQRKPFIMAMQITGENDLHELRGNHDDGYNEGTSYLFSKLVNWCQGDDFSSVHGCTNERH